MCRNGVILAANNLDLKKANISGSKLSSTVQSFIKIERKMRP